MPPYTVNADAAAHSEDRTYTFRVDATVVSTNRGASPTRNLDWDSATRYAEHISGTGRYRDVRIGVDSF